MTAFPKVARALRKKHASDILLVGGGIIPDEDKPKLERLGITGNFGPGTSLRTIIDHIAGRVQKERWK
jgi:methylmalonyl-CoA mutase C-terminal domain/subunit